MTEEHVLADANKYELMVIVNPDIGMDAVKKRLDEIRKVLTAKKAGVAGEIFFEDVWGQRDLAYHIKKHDKGFYAVFDFTADPSMIREMETTFKLEPEVIRHMIIRLPGSYQTLNYAALLEKQAIEEQEAKAAKLAAKNKRPLRPGEKPEVRVITKAVKAPEKAAEKVEAKAEEKAEAKVEEKVEVKEEVKEKPKKKETTLEDVDAKLKSIIDNPDINF
jgi:small subunit ribosomal protein S6